MKQFDRKDTIKTQASLAESSMLVGELIHWTYKNQQKALNDQSNQLKFNLNQVQQAYTELIYSAEKNDTDS